MSVPEQQSVALERADGRAGWRVVAIAAAVFAALWLWAAATSEGFIEADARTHYLSARFALQQPHRLISVWDRPLFMLLYSVPAALVGVMGTRAVSLILALACAWSAWRIAGRLGMRRPEWAFAITLASPMVFLHSFSEMTELCFAAVLGLALLAYLDRRWALMAALVAIAPLGRPEGFGLILLTGAALAMHRKWWQIVILPMGLLTWTVVGWLMWGLPDYGYGPANPLVWLPKQWPYSGASAYEAGPLLLFKTQSTGEVKGSFLMRLPAVTGPLVFPFMLAGTAVVAGWLWRGSEDRPKPVLQTQAKACTTNWGRIALVALPWGFLAVHSLLWWRAKMASSGELRYLLATAPLWGVIGAIGWEWTLGRWQIRRAGWVLAGLVLLPAVLNFKYQVVPLKIYEDDLLAQDVATWYRADPELQRKYPRLTASYIAVYQYLDFSMTDRRKTVVWGKPMLTKGKRGVIVVWDEVYGTKNADANMCVTREELAENGWKLLRTFVRGERTWEVYTSPEAVE